MASDLSQLVANLKISANIPNPAQHFHHIEQGLASIYSFEIKPGDTIVYRYDVEMTELTRGKSLTKGGGDDGKKGLLRNVCYDIMYNIQNQSNVFNTSCGKALFVYDNRKILFTNQRIQTSVLEINSEDLNAESRDFLRGAKVRVEIQPCQTERKELNLNDIQSALCMRPDEQADRSLRTFLEMLTSQPFINSRTSDLIGVGRLFERNVVRNLGDGIVTRRGVAKGVRIIANGDVKPCPALVADVKTCAFYANYNLEQIVVEMARNRRINTDNSNEMQKLWPEFNSLFRGVSGTLTYAPSRVIVIDTLTQRNINDISFDMDGKNMRMVQYFAEKKNIRVNGNFPAVRQQNDRDALFPMSCIIILPNQRVPLERMPEFVIRELLNANSTRPNERYSSIEDEMRRIGDPKGLCGQFMHKWGVKLKGGRNNVEIGIRNPLKIRFANMEATADQRGGFDASARGSKYLVVTSELRVWTVAHTRRINQEKIREFVEKIMRTAQSKGMRLPPPNYTNIELEGMRASFEQLSGNKVQYVLYIDNKFTRSHSTLKLMERRYGIITQHVTFENAMKAGAATQINIVNKMNMKLFGLNYAPILDNITKKKFDFDNTLVVGIDTSRPPRASAFERFMLTKKNMPDLQSEEPMIVGICANYVGNPMQFCGDYYYQPCKQDVLDPEMLEYKFTWVLNRLKQSRKSPPQMIFIIRDGISEGMIPSAIKNEFTVFKRVVDKFDGRWKPKFIFSIVDKRHNKRFFVKNAQGNIENTMPGSVIDRKFTRVDMHEFFLQSHYPLKGVSSIPQYVFPVNEANATNDELQGFIHALCNCWQIVNLPPALPTPVRQARELAKRGRNNWMELKRTDQQAIPRVQETRQVDYIRLNQMLSYNGHRLATTRFNA